MLFNISKWEILNFAIVILIVLFFMRCSNNENSNLSVVKKVMPLMVFVLQNEPKAKLYLKDDGEFEFVNIANVNFPNDMYFRTSGKWQKKGNEISISSIENSSKQDSNTVIKEASFDSIYSTFRFYDIYNDSVGFMYVTYANGRKYFQGSDLGDSTFDWIENLKKTTSLEFHFVNYENWKYYSDGKNFNIKVFLKPKFKANFFKDEKFRLNGDTLISILNSSKYLFIKEK